ncbi:MAG: rhodanese-like domain-containing protein [Thermovirgaceae bacterium]
MLLRQIFTEKIAHSSYILAVKSSCAVIDPRRDIQVYLDEAQAMGVAITHIFQTHLHADFVSGHMDLAAVTGAKIHVPRSAECVFDHVPLSEKDTVEIENLLLEVVETPGHTPEHVAYVVKDLARSDSPVAVFTGDTLFVGDVGRPDLFPGKAEDLAGKLYHSLHDKLLSLPDHCEVYPAHGAGSLCGRSMAAKRTSTIGYERLFNPALNIEDKEEFIHSLTNDMPPAPDHFSRCTEINRQGPELLSKLPVPEELDPAAFRERAKDVEILDVRTYDAFSGHHVSGSWNLDLNGNFPTFAGWVLPVDKDILLVDSGPEEAEKAVTGARRVGVDRITGILAGGMPAWVTAGFSTGNVPLLSAGGLHGMITDAEKFILLDVRAPAEFDDNHIEGALNIPVDELRSRHEELDRQKSVVVICSSGNRGSIAASILKQKGFSKLFNVAGGMTGYSAAGYTKRCHACNVPHGPRFLADE